jgi:hypothetical protein
VLSGVHIKFVICVLLLVTLRQIKADFCEESCKRHVCTGEPGRLAGLSTSVTPYKIIRVVHVVFYVCSKQRRINLSKTQTMKILRNIESLSRNHCCIGKEISIRPYVCVCICSLSYPACNARAPYYIVSCGLSGSTIFSTLPHKGHDFRQKVIESNVCFDFLYKFVSNISDSKKNSVRYYHKCT